MTVQKTLKLTALSLGIASIALTGCKGKDGDKGVDGKSEKTTIPTDPAVIKTNNGEELPHFIIKYDGTIKDKDGNVYQATYKVGRHTQPEIKILGPGLPSNSCVGFEVVVKDINNKEIVLNNAAAFYDEDGRTIDKKIIYNLDGESQKIASIKGSTICVLKKEELNKLHSVHNNNKDHADNADFREMNTFHGAKIGDTITLVVEGMFDKVVRAPIKVIDPEINIAGIEGNKHYIPIPAGTQSGAFRIFGKKATRDLTTQEVRKGVSYQERATIDKGSVEYIALYDSHTGKEITDALVADEKNHTWRIDSSKIPHDYIKNPNLQTYNEHEIVLKLVDGTAKLRIPVYIKIEKAIPVEYKVTQLNTNVYGKQQFHVLLRYSNSNQFVNIAQLPDSERKNINLTFNITKNLEKAKDSAVKITSTLEGVNASFNETGISEYTEAASSDKNKLAKFDKTEHSFWIDAQNAPDYLTTPNKYQLVIKPVYTRNFNESQLTADELSKLSANKRLNYTCGNSDRPMNETEYNDAKKKLKESYQIINQADVTKYTADKLAYDIDIAKIGGSADYVAYLASKQAISEAEFNRIKGLTAPAEVVLAEDKSNQAAFDQFTADKLAYDTDIAKIGGSADYAAYLASKQAINEAEFNRIKGLTAPAIVSPKHNVDVKPANYDAAVKSLGESFKEYEEKFNSESDNNSGKIYNDKCTVKLDQYQNTNSIVAIDKTIKGTNENGEIIRHFVISPFNLVLETKPMFYSIEQKGYVLSHLTKDNSNWTPDLFVGASEENANERYKYGCVKLVSEFKVVKHTRVNGKLERVLKDSKHDTLTINNFILNNHSDLKTDDNRIDPKIVNINGKTSESLRQNNIYCPSKTESVGAKKLVAEFQDLKSNEIALNVIDVRMPILTMLFENGQTKYTFASNSEVSILPFYIWSSGKFEKAPLDYASIHQKFTYTHNDIGNKSSYYYLVDGLAASQQTDTFRKLLLSRPEMASSNLVQKTSVSVTPASSASMAFSLTNDAATFDHIIKYESYFNTVPKRTTIDLETSSLAALSNDQGASEHYHDHEIPQVAK